jgi:hypothetical protein
MRRLLLREEIGSKTILSGSFSGFGIILIFREIVYAFVPVKVAVIIVGYIINHMAVVQAYGSFETKAMKAKVGTLC